MDLKHKKHLLMLNNNKLQLFFNIFAAQHGLKQQKLKVT